MPAVTISSFSIACQDKLSALLFRSACSVENNLATGDLEARTFNLHAQKMHVYTGPGQDVEMHADLQNKNSKLRLALCWGCAILNFDPFTERPRRHLALHSHHSPHASVTNGEHTRTEFISGQESVPINCRSKVYLFAVLR